MDVSTLKTPEPWQPAGAGRASGAAAEGTAPAQPNGAQDADADKVSPKTQNAKIAFEEVEELTHRLNEFMDSLAVNIHFDIHEKTKKIMVRVMDSKDQRVLREYPPQELLDTLGAISDYVGVLLDKKA